MRWRIVFTESAEEDLARLRPFDRARVLRAIIDNLSYEPTSPTRNRKRLRKIDENAPPWELRVGDVRVYYEVREGIVTVKVLGVRNKGRKTTGETL